MFFLVTLQVNKFLAFSKLKKIFHQFLKTLRIFVHMPTPMYKIGDKILLHWRLEGVYYLIYIGYKICTSIPR